MNKYLKTYFLFLLVFFAVGGALPIWYLYRVGEYTQTNEIIEKQNQSNGKVIYGSALHSNRSYKLLLLNTIQPRIIVLGSSRVLHFRQHMFLKKFINLGGEMGSINEGISIIPYIIDKNPDIVLIGVDYWWFNDKFQKPNQKPTSKPNDVNNIPSLNHSLMVFRWLFDGKITFKKIIKVIVFGTTDVGVAGQEKDGFGPDGSHYLTRLITGEKNHHDILFKNTFKRIKEGKSRFEYNSLANKQHIDNFIQLIRELEENNIEVVIFLNPFAKAVNERLNVMRDRYQYISDTKINLQKNNINFHDYTDATIIGSNDCEFLDGFHGGEVTCLRILSDLAQKVRSLDGFVDQRLLRESISKYKGKTFIPDDEISSNTEIDFLGLGCNK